MTTERIHPGHCPTCDAIAAVLAEIPPARLRTPSPARRWFEAAMSERWCAT